MPETGLEADRKILNAATDQGNPGNPFHGGKRRFWYLSRDDSVNGIVYGEQVIIVSPENSALINSLNGVAPFDGSQFPRMQIGRPPISRTSLNGFAMSIFRLRNRQSSLCFATENIALNRQRELLMDLFTIRFGEQIVESDAELESIGLSGVDPDESGSTFHSNFFVLPHGRLYFVTEFKDKQSRVGHSWHGEDRTIEFVGEDGKRFVSSIDLVGDRYSPWKVVAYDSDGDVAAARKLVSNAGKCFVFHYPKGDVQAEGLLCSGVRDGNPVRVQPDVNLSLGRLFFFNRFTTAQSSVTHMWYNADKQSHDVVEARIEDKGRIGYSSLALPSDPLGYWKVIAFDGSGEYLCYRDFHIEPL